MTTKQRGTCDFTLGNGRSGWELVQMRILNCILLVVKSGGIGIRVVKLVMAKLQACES